MRQNSPRRRSTQTALHRLVLGLLSPARHRCSLSPADEAWRFYSGQIRANPCHLTDWTGTGFVRPEAEQKAWQHLFELREFVPARIWKSTPGQNHRAKALDAKVSLGPAPILR